MQSEKYVLWFEEVGIKDIGLVGGKNASLGELIQHLKAQGVRVPDGFAITSRAYWDFIKHNDLETKIRALLSDLKDMERSLEKAGRSIRRLFLSAKFPENMSKDIIEAYRELSRRYSVEEADVAVRSSATAEDLPDASFAGQQETILNVTGDVEILHHCLACFASLFTDRAIYYRVQKGFNHMDVALSIGVQKMVRSDLAGSGVCFSIDTESGFDRAAIVTASWGLGEMVVQGAVTPDEYRIFKPLLDKPGLRPIIHKEMGTKQSKMVYAKGTNATTKIVDTSHSERKSFVLNDDEILQMADWVARIEKHYGRPMDIEWAKDGVSGNLFIVQARPETVQSQKKGSEFKIYKLSEKGNVLTTGIAIGDAIAVGKAKVIKKAEDIAKFEDGCILVTEITDPNWVPIMKRARGIITDQGGRTSHAAIISRELGIPAVVGTDNATSRIKDGQEITLSCAEGNDGIIYEGTLRFETEDLNLADIPETKTQIKLNIASPAASFYWWRLPASGIGLARMEFIITNVIKIHPMALLKHPYIKDKEAIKIIDDMIEGFPNKKTFFVDNLARGIASIAAPHYPHPVIVRMSDFKTNEYADLIGGREFEPKEENPMLGFRGASRYYSDEYKEGFAMECEAIRKVRDEIGLNNVWVMIPFCRTLTEADRVLEELAKNGLRRGEGGLHVYVMAEIPANIILAEEFADRFDGFSIGSNDLTQLTLGVDRDSGELAYLFDERNDAIKRSIRDLITRAHKKGKHVGLCGQGPSDYPEFAEFLVEAGIDSMSLNPDKFIEVKKRIARLESGISETPAPVDIPMAPVTEVVRF